MNSKNDPKKPKADSVKDSLKTASDSDQKNPPVGQKKQVDAGASTGFFSRLVNRTDDSKSSQQKPEVKIKKTMSAESEKNNLGTQVDETMGSQKALMDDEAPPLFDRLKNRFFNQVVEASPSSRSEARTTDAKVWGRSALISSIVAALMLIWVIAVLLRNSQYLEDTGNLKFLAQQIQLETQSAVSEESGSLDASFESLAETQQEFRQTLGNLSGLISSSSVDRIEDDWPAVDQSITDLLAQKEQLVEVAESRDNLASTMDDIQVYYRELSRLMLNGGYSPSQVATVKDQLLLIDSILAASRDVGTNAGLIQLGQGLNELTQQFGQVAKAQLNGSQALGVEAVTQPFAQEQVESVEYLFDEQVQPSVQQITDRTDAIRIREESAREIRQRTRAIANELESASASGVNQALVIAPIVGLLMSLLVAVYSFYSLRAIRAKNDLIRVEQEQARQNREVDQEVKRAKLIQQENKRNQNAILRLLDELGDLADGDLTVNATVSEDFTGAIADSVNFAIDQLRSLVSAINSTSIMVTRSSNDTQNMAMKLAEASEHQAQEIAGASAAINEMAVSIDQVSANAMESATVAERSVAIAYNGGEVVQRTIDGMNMIREQIQETSKRIKRLGESSQEIGDIVSLINDIADQTNILALNAAIQASAAGEAGRGFAVVADEVQRLAERSASATRQIETLVKTIQADTNEAVSSMETTTSEVVKGAKLAKDAGEALGEVQTVSNTLSDLIQNISNAARQQAASAGHISSTMNIIQEITTQTTSGTISTARSVGQLNEMSMSLRESVSGFKLPEESSDSVSV